MNVIIQTLVFVSFILEAGFGLYAPVFAVFVTEQIQGGDVVVVGFTAATYWILKSILQIPVGRTLDKYKGEIDDFWALFTGHLIMGLAVFLHVFAKIPLHLYLLSVLLAVGGALAVPPWYAMFTRHIDKLKEGFEWSIYSSLSFGLGTGGAGALGGLLVKAYGFNFVFVAGAILIWTSVLLLLVLRRHLFNHERPPIPKLPYPL